MAYISNNNKRTDTLLKAPRSTNDLAGGGGGGSWGGSKDPKKTSFFQSLGNQNNSMVSPLSAPTQQAPVQSGYVAPQSNYNPPANTGMTQGVAAPTMSMGAPTTASESKRGLVATPKPKSQFGQFTEGLQNAGKPTAEQQRYLKQVEDASQRGMQIGEEAQRVSDMYGSEIARVGQLGAGAVAGAKTTGTDVVGRGNAAIASESASNRISSLSAAQAAAQQGFQQQLTAADQGLTGMTSALTGANTQQQLAQAALAQGGQLAQPSVAQFGQTVFDPTTGQYTGGSLDPQQQAQSLAQQVMSGAMTYDQALASMSYTPIGVNALNSAVTGAGGNPLALQAQNAAQQANIATGGTFESEVARTGYEKAQQDYMQMENFATAAKAQANDLINVMEQTEVNGQPLARANKAINTIASETNDPNVKSFLVSLQEAQALYQRLLSTGSGTPTGVEERALAVLDGSATPEVTRAAIQQLESAAINMLSAQAQTANQYRDMIQNQGGNQTGGGGGQWDW